MLTCSCCILIPVLCYKHHRSMFNTVQQIYGWLLLLLLFFTFLLLSLTSGFTAAAGSQNWSLSDEMRSRSLWCCHYYPVTAASEHYINLEASSSSFKLRWTQLRRGETKRCAGLLRNSQNSLMSIDKNEVQEHVKMENVLVVLTEIGAPSSRTVLWVVGHEVFPFFV